MAMETKGSLRTCHITFAVMDQSTAPGTSTALDTFAALKQSLQFSEGNSLAFIE